VRHGATAWNAERRFQGQSDVPLSDEGRRQAQAIARVLAHETVDAVYASDLSRALETARIVAEPHPVAVRADPRLREFDFGAWEGLTWDEIVASRPHLQSLERTRAAVYEPEGGETFARVRERVAAVLSEILAAGSGHVVVVTHAGPLHATMAELGFQDAGATFVTAGITRVAMEEGRPRLITLSDVRHLYSPGRP